MRASESHPPGLIPATKVNPMAVLTENLPETQPTQQYCIFRAGRHRFCLPVAQVDEVVDWPSLTPLPLAPSFVLGLFHVRGSVLAAVDIAAQPDPRGRHMLVAHTPAQDGRSAARFGIAADAMIGTFSTAELPQPVEDPQNAPHAMGTLQYDGGTALALDSRRLAEKFSVPLI